MSEEREWYGDGLPPVGMTCVAVPHGTDWGFDSLDPVGVVIKAYDGDFVWMLANRERYITTHTNKVKFIPVATQRQPARKNTDNAYSTCHWRLKTSFNPDDKYATSCGRITASRPVNFCPYCGGELGPLLGPLG